MAINNCLFIDYVSIKAPMHWGCSIGTFDYWRVLWYHYQCYYNHYIITIITIITIIANYYYYYHDKLLLLLLSLQIITIITNYYYYCHFITIITIIIITDMIIIITIIIIFVYIYIQQPSKQMPISMCPWYFDGPCRLLHGLDLVVSCVSVWKGSAGQSN